MAAHEHTNVMSMDALQWSTLALLAFTALSYLLRTLVFRRQVRHLLGFFDVMGELGHSVCALLMIPMVVPALMVQSPVREWAAILSLIGGVFFTLEGFAVTSGRLPKYPQYKPWWSFAHGGMYLGMAHMYWAHDHVVITPEITQGLTVISGAFYLWFCGYYFYALVTELRTTRGTGKWGLYLQANVAHLFGIGLPMLGMLLWPQLFMSGHDLHASSRADYCGPAPRQLQQP